MMHSHCIPTITLAIVFASAATFLAAGEKPAPAAAIPKTAYTNVTGAAKDLASPTARPVAQDWLEHLSADETVDHATRADALLALGKNYVTQRDYPKAISRLTAASQLATNEAQFEISRNLVSALALGGDKAAAVRILEPLVWGPVFGNDEAQHNLFTQLLTLQVAIGQSDRAIESIDRVLREATSISDSFLIELAKKRCAIQQDSGQSDAIIPWLASRIETQKNTPLAAVSLNIMLADAYLRITKDKARAETTLLQAVTNPPNMRAANTKPDDPVAKAYSMLLALYADMPERAEDLFAKSIEALKVRPGNSALVTEAGSRLVSGVLTDEQERQACSALRSVIVADPMNSAAVDAAQGTIVAILIKKGRLADALQEARILYWVCSDSSLSKAVDQVTTAFKATDGNLARANRFLKYLKYGVAGEDGKIGTADDIEDPLWLLPVTANAERDAVYEVALKAAPTDWIGQRQRSRIDLLLSRPADAFDALRRAFTLCPTSEKELQATTDSMVGLIVRCRHDTVTAQQLVKYLMFGPSGPDGIADPTPALAAMLSHPSK
jgi:tetratricopeptide (TPR) repeat protein